MKGAISDLACLSVLCFLCVLGGSGGRGEWIEVISEDRGADITDKNNIPKRLFLTASNL